MKLFTLVFGLSVFSLSGLAQECLDASRCRSQLVRVEASNASLNTALNSRETQESMIGAVDAFLGSEAFKRSFVRDYPMEQMGFPFNSAVCLSEKNGNDPNFRNVDCSNPLLCTDPNVNEAAKREVCFDLPCPLLLGRNRRQCPASGSDAMPATIDFPTPVRLVALENMRTISSSIVNNRLNACVSIGSLEVRVSTRVNFRPDPHVTFESIGLDNLRIVTDGPREVCLTARVDPRRSPAVTEITLERQKGDFVSNKMIDAALAGASPVGLSGYSRETVEELKTNMLSSLVRHFRPAMEGAIQNALAATFQEQMGEWSEGNVATPLGSTATEMGVANTSFKKYVDLMDCALVKAEQGRVPTDHACVGQIYATSDDPLRVNRVPSITEAAALLSSQASRYGQISSEALRTRLEGFQQRLQARNLASTYANQIAPAVRRIQQNQSIPNTLNGIELITRLGDETTNAQARVVVPELCDAINPSPYEGRSMKNCPVQAYVDLNELNRLFADMYRSGALCHNGRGDYRPTLNSAGKATYNRDGSPIGTGCLFIMEEAPKGMRCFLNGPPSINFIAATGKYVVKLDTKECYRGPHLAGQGKIGGDVNFKISFTPGVCGEGDFCLQNGDAEWDVVPGTERLGFRSSSILNGIIRRTIDKKLNDIIGDTIRIPLARGSGMMGAMPLVAEGQVDTGNGFFGACLRPRPVVRP